MDGIGATHPVIHSSHRATLRAIGKDEYWLQAWIAEDPSRLGIGKVVIKAKELRQYGAKGGRHAHRHGTGSAHIHFHDHDDWSVHAITAETDAAPPLHAHKHKTSSRTALLLILGSSPMVEGIPAFFAAGNYGAGVIVLMALVFAVSTIATYVLLCVTSAAGLQRVRLGAFERYGEVLSGAFIVLVGVAFWIWPVL